MFDPALLDEIALAYAMAAVERALQTRTAPVRAPHAEDTGDAIGDETIHPDHKRPQAGPAAAT